MTFKLSSVETRSVRDSPARMEFIEQQKSLYIDLAPKFEKLGDLYSQKLWHQLSLELEIFLSDKGNHRNNNVLELYSEFISKFEARLGQVRFALLVSKIGHSLKDTDEALSFLNNVLTSRTRLGPEASLCIDMDVVLAKLKLQQIGEAETMLDEAKTKLAGISSNESAVFSKFFVAVAEYRKIVGPPQEFYKAALLLLAYTPIEEIPAEQKFILATDIALASITGEDIYNFGEVIATPILAVLKGTSNDWMRRLVLALNKGDIDLFNSIVAESKDQYYAQPSLSSRHEEIKKKLVLLSLMNIVFERPSHDRTITFTDIATRIRIPLDQVEWVLMRAMSLGLIKGTIDGCDQTVSVTWVLPRVLDNEQLGILVKQLEGWTDKVKTTLVSVSDQTSEILV